MNRKYEILDAAMSSFSLFGYKATTIEQVAKLAKVGKGTVYTFFNNKHELLQSVVLNMINEMKQDTDRTLDPSKRYMENVNEALLHLLKYREKHLLFSKLLEEGKQLRTPEVMDMLQKIETETTSYIAEYIQKAIDKGEVRHCEPKVVAYLLIKAYMALVVDWQLNHKDPLTEEAIVGVLKDTIFRGLEK